MEQVKIDVSEYKSIAEDLMTKRNIVPYSIANMLSNAIRSDERIAEEKAEEASRIKERLMVLMQQGNYELVARIVKKVTGDESFEQVERYVNSPGEFARDLKKFVQREGLNVGKYSSLYTKYVASFMTHFRTSMSEWEQWQLELFRFEVDIISAYLAYKTVDGSLKEDEIITELIQQLEPYNPDISGSDVFLKKKFRKTAITTGIIGILAGLVLYFGSKGEKNDGK